MNLTGVKSPLPFDPMDMIVVRNDSVFSIHDIKFTEFQLNDINNYVASDEIEILKRKSVAVTIVIIYVIVIVLGTLGSTLVFVTVVKTRAMWNATNTFIANLAVADIFVCSFDLPLTLYYQLTEDWVFSRPLCHVIPAMFAITNYSSTLTLAVIAIDRYLLIVCPLKPKISGQVAVIIVVVIGLLSIAASTPIAIYANYYDIHIEVAQIHRRYCTENWPNALSRQFFTALSLLLQFFIPLIVIAFLYYLIFVRLRRRVNTKQTTYKTRTNKMLLAVVSVFAITWLPYHLLTICSEFWSDRVTGRYFRMTDLLLRVLALSSSCINPFLYGWMNRNFRLAFLAILKQHLALNINWEQSVPQHHSHQQLQKQEMQQKDGISNGNEIEMSRRSM